MPANIVYESHEIELADGWVKLSEISQVVMGTFFIESGMENALIRVDGGTSKRLTSIASGTALYFVDLSTVELSVTSGTLKVSFIGSSTTP